MLVADSVTGMLNDKRTLKRLKQSMNYYARISINYKTKTFYSPSTEFRADTLRLLEFPEFLSRGVWASVKSNFRQSTFTNDTSTRIYLNSFVCTIPFTNGETTQFVPPSTLPSGKYALWFERNGISVKAPDSVEVLKGHWSELTPPEIPLAPGFSENGLGYYGSCFSDQKGYIIPGHYFRQIPYGDPNFGRPGHILSFDGLSGQWSKLIPNNPMYFETPICQFTNNSIYVLGGWTTDMYNANIQRIQEMLRFDLNTSNWIKLDSLPYPSVFNLVSFEFNNEFYVGMGADMNNLSQCCGLPLPSKKFWKYNPQTNTWTRLADFPGQHEYNQNNPTAFTIGSKAYVFYGAIPVGDPIITTDFRQELWEYDPENNTWSQISLPSIGAPPAGEKYQIISHNGKAYFLTAQKHDLFSYYYGFTLKTPCLEFDPTNNSFRRISTTNNLGILKLIFKKDNNFYFQADAFGYTDNIPNKTYLLTLE
jgi:N-acetylneuraminic acid mutarotase